MKPKPAFFSEVIDKALHEGPQTISDSGTGVIVVSEDEYNALAKRKPTFTEHLLGGPKADDFTIERDLDTGRDFEF